MVDEDVCLVVEGEGDLEDPRLPQAVGQDEGEAVAVVVVLLPLEERRPAELVRRRHQEDVLALDQRLRVDLHLLHDLLDLKRGIRTKSFLNKLELLCLQM